MPPRVSTLCTIAVNLRSRSSRGECGDTPYVASTMTTCGGTGGRSAPGKCLSGVRE